MNIDFIEKLCISTILSEHAHTARRRAEQIACFSETFRENINLKCIWLQYDHLWELTYFMQILFNIKGVSREIGENYREVRDAVVRSRSIIKGICREIGEKYREVRDAVVRSRTISKGSSQQAVSQGDF